MPKKLPTKEELRVQTIGNLSVPQLLRNDEKISKWLIDIFSEKEKGSFDIRFTDIAKILSDYKELEINGESVGKAFRRWKTTGRL